MIDVIRESLGRLQSLADRDIIRVRPSDMDEFLSEWRQAMEDIRKALCQQDRAELPGGWEAELVTHCDAQGFIVRSPAVNGVQCGTAVFADSEDPAERMLYMILAASPQPKETGEKQ